MATVVDKASGKRGGQYKSAAALRHPEKQRNSDSAILKKPEWLRVKAPGSPVYNETKRIVGYDNLVTVCEEAACPNIGTCWSKKHATMMIMGDTCTRACAFCYVKTGLPNALDVHEPNHVANAVARLELEHVVITSVDRDDLADGGAEHFARHQGRSCKNAANHHRSSDA